MIENRPLSDSGNLRQLFLLGTLLSALFLGYLVYSVSRFNLLAAKSVVKSKVVMRVIQHDVRCVCPRCGLKGAPTCPHCSVDMYWNGYKGTFVCSGCGKGGFPQCRQCGTLMVWIELE
ncbi:hypothetical protein ACFL1X_09625 [Candidatus Hydrogenedentota bacterium]